MSEKIDLKARHNARKHLVQALYQRQFTQFDIRDIELQFQQNYLLGKRVDIDYFTQLLHGTSEKSNEIDQAFTPYLTRPINDIDPIELCILRLATFELLFRLEIPHQIIINEALELAKTFASQESFRFINGVLDKVAQKTRPFAFSSNP